MLSLPDNWDYTLSGLAVINKEGVDSIRTAVNELENNGYVVRSQGRSEAGKFGNNEYIVYEQPSSPKPPLEKPSSDNPTTGFPITENPTQLNIDKENKELQNKDQSIYHSNESKENDGMDTIDDIQNKVKKNIEYEILVERYPKDKDRIKELYGLMVEVLNSNRISFNIAGETIPTVLVKSRFMEINQQHIEYVIDSINQNRTKVKDIKKYLLTVLYNAPLTMDHYYTALVNHHYYGNGNK